MPFVPSWLLSPSQLNRTTNGITVTVGSLKSFCNIVVVFSKSISSGDRLRITAQLVETGSGANWLEAH